MIFIISQHVIEKHHSQDNMKVNSKDQISSLSMNRSNSSSNATIETDDSTSSSTKTWHASESQDSVNHTDCSDIKRRIECDSPISSSQFPNVLDEDQYVEYPNPNDDSESYEEVGYGHYAPALHDEHQCSSSNQGKAHTNPYSQTGRVDYEDSDEEHEGEEGCEDYEQLEEVAYDDCSFDYDDELIEQHADSTERVIEEKPSVIESKPFFIMDFLEQVNPDDLKLAQSMLMRPESKNIKSKMHRSHSWHTKSIDTKKDEDQNIFQQLTKKLSFFNAAAANRNEKRKDILVATEKMKHTADCSSSSCFKPICKDLFTRKIIQPLQQEPRQHQNRNMPSSTELCQQQDERVSSNSLSAALALSDSASSSCFFQQSVTIGNKYNARGIHYATTGEWKKALFYWKDALEIRTQVLGKKSIDVADTCNNIGIALGKLQRPEEALTAFHRALQIQTEYYQNHSNESDQNEVNSASDKIDAERVTSKRACHLIATTYHNMGNIYQQSNAYYNAIQCYSECETILKTIYGPENLEVARSLVAMGHTYRQAAADETSSKEALALALKSDPALSVQRYEHNIRDCCYSYYYEDAKQAYIDALRIFELLGYQRSNSEMKSIIDDISALEKRIKMCL